MKTISTLLLALLCFNLGMTQNLSSTAGGTMTEVGVSIDWSIGEVFCKTLSSDDGAMTSGFLQPIASQYDISITDPCGCDDPQNVIDGNGFVQFYHDQIIISAATIITQQFKVVQVLEGEVLTSGGVPIVGTPIAESYQDGNNQVIDIWRVLGPRYKVVLENQSTGQLFEFTADTDCIPCPQIPSMGQWALFILFLILSNIALVYIHSIKHIKTEFYSSK